MAKPTPNIHFFYIGIIHLFLLILLYLLIPCNTFSQFSGALIPDFRVNDDTININQQGSYIAVDQAGNYFVVWADARINPYQVYYQLISYNGNFVGTNFNFDISALNGQVVTLKNERFIAVWVGSSNGLFNVYCRKFSYNGTPLSGITLVTDTSTSNSQYLYNSAIDCDSSGNIVIGWMDHRKGILDPDVYIQRLDSSCNKLGNNIKVNDNTTPSDQWAPSVLVNNNGSFIVCWTDVRITTNPNIYIQKYDNYGVKIGINEIVNDDTINAFQQHADISGDKKGYFVVAFGDFREVYNRAHTWIQLYDTNGTKIGINQKVDENFGQTGATVPKVSMQQDGKFVVMWTDYRLNNYIPFAQRYTKNGIKIGVNFYIPVNNSITTYGAFDCVLHNNRIYTCWLDPRNGDYDVFSNVRSFFNPDSVLVGLSNIEIPLSFRLITAYPNPFNSTVKIKYELNYRQYIKISIYNINGEKISTLTDNIQNSGNYNVEWSGNTTASGIYFIVLENNINDKITKKIILLK